MMWKCEFNIQQWWYEHVWGVLGRGMKKKQRVASWILVTSTPVTVVLHKGRWTSKCSSTRKTKLKRMIRYKEFIPCKGCLKRFEPFSLGKTWLNAIWPRSELMVPLEQSSQSLQNAASQTALHDRVLHGFRIKHGHCRGKGYQLSCWAWRLKKKLILTRWKLRKYTRRGINVFVPSFTLSHLRYLHVSGRVLDLDRCLIWNRAVLAAVLWCWEEHEWEYQLWVQKDDCLEELILVSLVCVCFSCQLWGSSGHPRSEPSHPSSMWVPHIPFAMLELSRKREYPK